MPRKMSKISSEMVAKAVLNEVEDLEEITEREMDSLESYKGAFEKARANPPKEFGEKLPPDRGKAVPLGSQWEVNFEKDFDTREEMRRWAYETLLEKPITGVDGSQAPADKVISLPVALVRACAFVNKHSQNFEKIERYRCLTPKSISVGEEDYMRLNSLEINLARFEMENEVALASQEEDPSLILMDNTFILSYLLATRSDDFLDLHLDSLLKLFKSTENNTMLAGIIDPSLAKDVSNSISDVYNLDQREVSDVNLVDEYLGIFDRTCTYRAKRNVLRKYNREVEGEEVDYRGEIGFFYMKTYSQQPTRVEFPLWIQREEKTDELADLVRASCILGEGYPYELSRAHEFVRLARKEKERFYEIVQKVAENRGLDYSISQKEFKKRRPVR